jgi:hypothetical protein
MHKLRNTILSGALLLTGHAAMAQIAPPISCVASAGAPPMLRLEGKAELVSDIVLTCTGGNPATTVFMNVSLFLNTNVTSNLTGPGPDETEALILIDEPKPSPTVNVSNGIPFVGQVKGTPAVVASGNVFTGSRTASVNQLRWLGVPLVPPGAGTRTFRFVNIRALPVPSGVAVPSPVVAFLSVTSFVPISIASPVQTVGFVQSGLSFTSTPAGPSLHLQFNEQFASAFKKRIENTPAGPVSPAKQNQPGVAHCTESGLNPDFTTVAPGDTGSANTGTRLAVRITGIPAGVPFVVAPNRVLSGGGQLVAARVAPPYGPTLSGGALILGGGLGGVAVAAGSATLLYEVVARAPYAGVNGCVALDSFNFTAQPWPAGSLAGTNVVGSFAPVDPTVVISAPAPEPRFN